MIGHGPRCRQIRGDTDDVITAIEEDRLQFGGKQHLIFYDQYLGHRSLVDLNCSYVPNPMPKKRGGFGKWQIKARWRQAVAAI